MTRTRQLLASLALFLIASTTRAHAGNVALLLEEPYGSFGFFNPTGHAAIYLSDVCADAPTHLRRCREGEAGVVISRYHAVDGYDWLAVPLIPYLYAVDNPEKIPQSADEKMVVRLRDRYRQEHLLDIVPDDPRREIPKGDWIQLVGESYDRRIYGLAVSTTAEQDDALIAHLNQGDNTSQFNLLFRNCANFSEGVLNFYYPHAISRNFIADAGLMTPKQAARSLNKYAKKHPEMDLRSFVIPQVPGSIPRSTPVDGVIESVVKSKKYVLPLAFLHPAVTGSLIAVYWGDGRYHPDPKSAVFEPTREETPLTVDAEPVNITATVVPVASQTSEARATRVTYQSGGQN